MAIHNASDLLVYAKTTNPEKQVTRIYVKTNNPIEFEDGQSTGKVTVSNITDTDNKVYDDLETTAVISSGESVLIAITTVLSGKDYSSTTSVVSGDYTYRDFTNDSNGIVPTLEISNGTTSPIGTLVEDAVIVEIITPGSSAIFDPVAFSTSASFSVNRDLRDITNKDSGGWSESMPGLKSFEMSTDSLQSVNPDTPLDGSDFFDKLKQDLPVNAEINLSFSDRIRNIIRTNVTQSAVDGFSLISGLTQLNLQSPDPFGGANASLLITGASTGYQALKYEFNSAQAQGKKMTFSLYIKGSGSTTSAHISLSGYGYSTIANLIVKVEGSGSASNSGGGIRWEITGLSTSTWTRVSFYRDVVDANQGGDTISFALYPGTYSTQDSDTILTSSWQVEFSDITDYQDPTQITHWQGNALVSSLSFDSGVEDNLTCSATFTGTGNIYPNGLGPELIGDTEFDLGVSGVDAGAWWIVTGESTIQNGYGKILYTAGADISYIQSPTSLLTPGDLYLLKYTVSGAASPIGSVIIFNAWEQDGADAQTQIPISVGTHEVLIKPGSNFLQLKRRSTSLTTTVWLSSISLKKVL